MILYKYMYKKIVPRFILAIAFVSALGIGITTVPASAKILPPRDSTQAIRSFDKTFTAYGWAYASACSVRLAGKDYGNYVVLSLVHAKGFDRTAFPSATVNLGMTARSASGSILRSVNTVQNNKAWWSAGAPAGSIGDNGQVRVTCTWPGKTINSSIIVKMYQL